MYANLCCSALIKNNSQTDRQMPPSVSVCQLMTVCCVCVCMCECMYLCIRVCVQCSAADTVPLCAAHHDQTPCFLSRYDPETVIGARLCHFVPGSARRLPLLTSSLPDGDVAAVTGDGGQTPTTEDTDSVSGVSVVFLTDFGFSLA